MKVTLLKIAKNKEVINRLDLQALADLIRKNPDERKVYDLRLHYQFMKPERLEDGQIAVDDEHTVNLPNYTRMRSL